MNELIPFLAVISGDTLISAVIWIVVAGVIFWLLNYLIDYCQVAEPFNRIAKVIVMLAAVIILINALLSIAGHPLWSFR